MPMRSTTTINTSFMQHIIKQIVISDGTIITINRIATHDVRFSV